MLKSPLFQKLAAAVVVILAVAGIAFAGLITWRAETSETSTDTGDLSFQNEMDESAVGVSIGEASSSRDVAISDVDTSEWNIYRNQDYGFELKFPPFWRYNPAPLPHVFLFGPPGESNEYQVQLWVTPESSLDRFYKDKGEKCAKVLVSGQESFRCESENVIASERGVDVPYEHKSIYIETAYNGMFYFLSVKGDIHANRFTIFDSLISTFQFTQ